jgi:hypothetical protein
MKLITANRAEKKLSYKKTISILDFTSQYYGTVSTFIGQTGKVVCLIVICIPVPSNGVMSSQAYNVVTFAWPPVHQGIEQETRSRILPLRRGL